LKHKLQARNSKIVTRLCKEESLISSHLLLPQSYLLFQAISQKMLQMKEVLSTVVVVRWLYRKIYWAIM